jgi:hypothetical protein
MTPPIANSGAPRTRGCTPRLRPPAGDLHSGGILPISGAVRAGGAQRGRSATVERSGGARNATHLSRLLTHVGRGMYLRSQHPLGGSLARSSDRRNSVGASAYPAPSDSQRGPVDGCPLPSIPRRLSHLVETDTRARGSESAKRAADAMRRGVRWCAGTSVLRRLPGSLERSSCGAALDCRCAAPLRELERTALVTFPAPIRTHHCRRPPPLRSSGLHRAAYRMDAGRVAGSPAGGPAGGRGRAQRASAREPGRPPRAPVGVSAAPRRLPRARQRLGAGTLATEGPRVPASLIFAASRRRIKPRARMTPPIANSGAATGSGCACASRSHYPVTALLASGPLPGISTPEGSSR